MPTPRSPIPTSVRVTTAGQTQTIIARLQTASQQLAAAQRRATTGLKLERLSDDPTSGAAVMEAAAGLRGVAQYTRNVDRIQASLSAEDSALQQLGDLTARARELGTAASNAGTSAASRAASASEVRELLAQAVALGNTRVGDTYVFGGLSNDGRVPFIGDGAPWVPTDPAAVPGDPDVPRFPDGQLVVEAGAGGQRLTGAHDGVTVFLGRDASGAPDPTRGVLPALRQMLDALVGGGTADVAAALTALDTADFDLQTTVGDLGARQNHADTLSTGLAALGDTLTREKSELSEADAEEAITEMLARQTAYQAAMLASAKVMGVSLADYLR